MSKRWGLLVAIGLTATLTAAWFASTVPRRPAQPNLLLITLDTTRADRLACYGDDDALTPALDELAKQGALFERAYAPAPQTLVSHATMLTGLHPPEHGLRLNGAAALDPEIPTLTKRLSEAGYETAAFIAASVLSSEFGLNQAFQVYDDDLSQGEKVHDENLQVRSGRQVVDAALNWLSQRQSEPFFCWCHLFDPHLPHSVHEREFGARFRSRPYDAEIAFVDVQLKRLVDHLQQSGRRGNTWIVVVGDHGEGLGEHGEEEHGYLVYDSTMHVPWIIAGPLLAKPGLRVADPVSLVDLLPTLLDCLGIAGHEPISGRSVKPLLEGQPLELRDCYGETEAPYFEAGWAPLRSLTTEEWRYIRTTRPELYRIKDDPRDERDLARDMPELVRELDQRLVDLESSMIVSAGKPVQLSSGKLRALRSLGYTGGGTHDGDDTRRDNLLDIKDRIAFPVLVRKSLNLTENGAFEQAEVLAEESVKGAPEYAMAHAALGLTQARQGRREEAAASLLRSYHLAPNHPNLTWVPIELGKIRLAQEEYELAVSELSEVLNRTSDSAELHLLCGIACGKLGRTLEAQAHFQSALSINPQADWVEQHWGDLLAETGDLDAATQHYLAALRIRPDSAETRERLAGLLWEQQKFAEAIDHYQEILQQQPRNLNVMVALSRALATADHPDVRDLAQAQQLAQLACQLTNFSEPVTLDALATVLAEREHYDEAILTAEKALRFAKNLQRKELADEIAEKLAAYRNRKPFRGPGKESRNADR